MTYIVSGKHVHILAVPIVRSSIFDKLVDSIHGLRGLCGGGGEQRIDGQSPDPTSISQWSNSQYRSWARGSSSEWRQGSTHLDILEAS